MDETPQLDIDQIDEDLARQLVELGYRGSGEVIRRDEFYEKKRLLDELKEAQNQSSNLASTGQAFSDPFEQALADREEANRSGQMATIIFIRDKNGKNQEISGYIDYAHRLRNDNFSAIFCGSQRLLPKVTDLSFYNWDSNLAVSNSTPNYTVIAEKSGGLLFKNKRDRKIVSVDPKLPTPGDNSTRTVIKTARYAQAVLYDHCIRRKN